MTNPATTAKLQTLHKLLKELIDAAEAVANSGDVNAEYTAASLSSGLRSELADLEHRMAIDAIYNPMREGND